MAQLQTKVPVTRAVLRIYCNQSPRQRANSPEACTGPFIKNIAEPNCHQNTTNENLLAYKR